MPRPKLNPTEEQRRKVKILSACGTPHEKIAEAMGIRSPKTLRKHFREELDLGALEANAKVASTLYHGHFWRVPCRHAVLAKMSGRMEGASDL